MVKLREDEKKRKKGSWLNGKKGSRNGDRLYTRQGPENGDERERQKLKGRKEDDDVAYIYDTTHCKRWRS